MLIAAPHLHSNQHHVTQLLRCVDRGTFTARPGCFSIKHKSTTVCVDIINNEHPF